MANTISQNFNSDTKVLQAKKLIQEALVEHQSKITGVKAADPELKKSYQIALDELGQNRGGKMFYPYIGSGFGNGPFVELADGSIKYDFIIGIGVHYFGHSHPGFVNAMVEGSIGNTAMQGHLQQNSDQAELISLLVAQAQKNGAPLKHCFLTSSGVMTAENALKMAFQKNYPKDRVLAFEKCFMGRTLAVSQITDKAAYRDGLPEMLAVDYLPFYDESDHQGSINRAVAKLNEHLQRHPNKYAAMCMELIQGEAGSWEGNTEYFKALIKILKENDIALIVDEVQTFGRTKELFAFQYFKLDQDVDFVNIGKNSQVCATIYREEFKPRPGLCSQTFTSASSAIHASKYVIEQLVNENYLGDNGKIMQMHNHFKTNLEKLNKKHPDKIEGPYGVGSMIAMTICKGDAAKSKQFIFDLFENGVIGFTAGANPTRVRFLLPIGSVETHHIDEVTQIIETTLGNL